MGTIIKEKGLKGPCGFSVPVLTIIKHGFPSHWTLEMDPITLLGTDYLSNGHTRISVVETKVSTVRHPLNMPY